MVNKNEYFEYLSSIDLEDANIVRYRAKGKLNTVSSMQFYEEEREREIDAKFRKNYTPIASENDIISSERSPRDSVELLMLGEETEAAVHLRRKQKEFAFHVETLLKKKRLIPPTKIPNVLNNLYQVLQNCDNITDDFELFRSEHKN